MLKDVTLGRYYQVDSALHRLDPRTKIMALVIYIVCVFLNSSYIACAVNFAVLLLLITLSRVPLGYMTRGLKSIVVIIVITDAVNILFVDDGIWKAALLTLRMVELILGSNILSLTTKPKTMADGIEKGLGWMSAIKVPVHDIATAISIAFRFIPILSAEADRMMEAQASRGADFETGGLVKRARALFPILVPLFSSAFRRADELALAMDSRLYGSAKPSSFHPLKYSKADAFACLAMASFLAGTILMRVYGI